MGRDLWVYLMADDRYPRVDTAKPDRATCGLSAETIEIKTQGMTQNCQACKDCMYELMKNSRVIHPLILGSRPSDPSGIMHAC